MSDDQGKWNFTSDEERRLAIEAEAAAAANRAEHEASAKSKWWIVALVLILMFGAVQIIEALKGNRTSGFIDFTLGQKDKK